MSVLFLFKPKLQASFFISRVWRNALHLVQRCKLTGERCSWQEDRNALPHWNEAGGLEPGSEAFSNLLAMVIEQLA